ncbi:069a6c25-a65f-45c7-97aa-be8576ca7ea9 [Sclerotinia trifoliorum]|uniref:069a6c25-a65f-45c7-97aa-be8576ca7ea9 n=1 Tax=Sclerotinia trifoliorum TaxID=28548 RepID=A0A8H2VM27_9HELO|nr:069a6c25-a65f-45c7-97aa-be8576ca7ea9 [Sclerotinia trifoliorum]
MRYSAPASLAFAVGALAASLRRDTCSFTLTASGGASGIVGQLDDGQLRILGGHPTATFTISNSATTDSKGRPCYLTSEANQYQCDTSMTATAGFAIGANGTYSHSGSPVFYACPSSDSDYNIYTTPVAGQTKCVKVGLTASGCFVSALSSSSAQMSTSTPSKPSVITATTTQHQTCAPSTVTVSSPAQTIYVTISAVSTAPGQTIYETKTLKETAPANTVVVTQTPSAQTIYVTSTAPGQTVHETQTQEKTAPAQTVYVTQTQKQTAAPSTVTVTQVQTITAVSTIAVSTPKPSHASSKASPVVSSVPSKATSTTPSSTSCPTNLDGTYTSPNLIIPVSSASPNTPYGTSYFGVVNSTVSSLFNFDIPASYASKKCSLVFLFPTQDMLETSSYTFSGSGAINFKQLSTTVTLSSTYNSIGSTKTDFGSKTSTPGTWTVVDTFDCPAGKAISFEMSTGGSNTNLRWFEDYNPSPIGLFITTC